MTHRRGASIPVVVVDQLSLAGPGADRGLGRYARDIAWGASQLPNVSAVYLNGSTRDNGFDGFRIDRMLASLRGDEYVFHATSAYHLPARKRQRWVCSIQDTIPLDLREYARLGLKSRFLFHRAKKSDLILANSSFTAQRVRDLLAVKESQVAICSLPVNSGFNRAEPIRSPRLDDQVGRAPYIVALADHRSFDPRKRLHWIKAMIAPLREAGIATVVAGRGIATASYPGATVVANPTDSELADMYSCAIATYYPTAYEGQGMPPLEAMAAGCPVIAFRNSAVEEMVSVDDFLLADPVPWQVGRLDSQMPDDTRERVVSTAFRWATDDDALHRARGLARAAASLRSASRFVDALASAYRKALQA